MESHLLQMRGLKQWWRTERIGGIVASFTDAWIETMLTAGYDGADASHLLQMRGLKL